MTRKHINDIKAGDIVVVFGDVTATVTATEITGNGYQRVFGVFDDGDLGMLLNQNCFVDTVNIQKFEREGL
jgi:hypothetical protein